MNILILAPHPFYQERGTPIAVRMLAEAYGERGHRVELATFHEGEDVTLPGVRLHRIRRLPGLSGIRPGFSLKKMCCDVLLFLLALRLVRSVRPQVIHAMEESCFMAWVFQRLYRIPYIYDMDSSLPDQIVEKMPAFRVVRPLMHRLVGAAAAAAILVAPVCEALEETAERYRVRRSIVLHDISLLKRPVGRNCVSRQQPETAGTRFVYVGNLESYQGIDLLLAAFAHHQTRRPADTLTVAGGPPARVEHYRGVARALGVARAVTFLGPQPVDRMSELFEAADVLVSPRIKGTNTPMKIYSYLDSGRAVLATRLATHTQVMDDQCAALADPTPEAFGRAMTSLSDQPDLRRRLAEHALRMVEQRYSRAAYNRTVDELCRYVANQLSSPASHEAMPRRPEPPTV